MTAVIQAEGLGKRYRRGAVEARGTLRDALTEFGRDPLRVFRQPKKETFWALKDVSLEVKEGEVLGLIGRNGAGKTTLLKILSRITKPTTGWAEIHGRVRSLLEVGTGFHGELTGRENAYLSGSILGMRKREIDRKLDEIVAFAEIEKFIDTPVKHYSSGMYVRLAFAVAAHLEPEILLVDEVLAVGDINFQRKCLGKMGDVAKAGRTVVLVSHQMNQMRRLCNRVAWIDGGQIRMTGSAHDVVSGYESAMSRGERDSRTTAKTGPELKGRFLSWEIVAPSSGDRYTVSDLSPVTIKVIAEIRQPLARVFHGIALYTHDQQLLWAWTTQRMPMSPGEHEFCYTFPTLPLRPGPYNWFVTLWEEGQPVDLWYCAPDMVVATENYQSGYDDWNGLLNLAARFEMNAKLPVVQESESEASV